MAEYYGVVRSNSPELSHYGIRGMKWGVRKAIERGDDKALSRQYRKAQRKLRKLNHESNWFKKKKKGQILEKIRNSKHKPIKAIGIATGAGIRSKIHYLKASDPGDLYMDRRRDKFKEAMNEAFRGTKYDQARLARTANLKKARNTKRVRALKRKIGLG